MAALVWAGQGRAARAESPVKIMMRERKMTGEIASE
jgi:hypothetical protein